MNNNAIPHIPVLLQEVIKYLAPKDHKLYVDGTFGAGGYSKAILSTANCNLISIDRDQNVQSYANEIVNFVKNSG